VNPKAVKNKPNNVYTDKKGDIHRRTEKKKVTGFLKISGKFSLKQKERHLN
jgi:hypothetical protein